MGKTSVEVKERYNQKAYDRIAFRVYKGEREIIQAHAASKSESVNAFIRRAIFEAIGREKG